MTTVPIGIALLLGVSTFTGCVSSRYQKAPKETPPPVMLGLLATPAPDSGKSTSAVETVLQSVIVYQGPGSWKRAAYWDEYVLSLANRSNLPVTLESVTLTDFQGAATSPGTDPWELERQSRSYEARLLTTTGTALKIGVGSVATTGAAVAVGTSMAGGLSGYAGAGVLLTSAGVALPAYAVGTIFANVHSKHRIEDQFSYRRLGLPLMLAPGQMAQGSLFFRITPGPQRLALHYRAGDATPEAIVELAPLADLHLNRTTAQPEAERSTK